MAPAAGPGSGRVAARRIPGWAPIVVLLAVAVWVAGRLGAAPAEEAFPPPPATFPSSFGTVDPRYARLDGFAEFVDDRWRPVLAAQLASLPEIPADEPESLEPIRAALAGLPFVAEVGEGSVLWPDGYKVEVRLRKPAACVRTGGGYLLVAEDGVVLPGEWKRPPWVAGGWLPVLGPLEDPPQDGRKGGDARVRPGGRIAERRHLDALSVAVSMRAALAAEDFVVLGAPVIDATSARAASVSDPGVVLELEDGRRVLFGRAPNSGEPGELPVERKWASLAKAARALRPTTVDHRDWSLLDVRWDIADVLWRDAAVLEPADTSTPPPAPVEVAKPRIAAEKPIAADPVRIPDRVTERPRADRATERPRDPPTNRPRVL